MPVIRRVAVATTLGLIAVAASPADALVVDIDNFQVFKNGASLMNDTFNIVGTIGTAGPMTPTTETLNTGSPLFLGIYGVLAPEAQAEGGVVPAGVRRLDTSLAPAIENAFGGSTDIHLTTSALITNTAPIGVSTLGLKSNDLIQIVGIFDLAIPTAPGEFYGLRVSDFVAAPTVILGDDEVRIEVRQNASGVNQTMFREADRTAGTIMTLAAVDLDPLHDQIMLIIENSLDDLSAFTGSFAYIDGGIVGAITTLAGSVTMFNGEDYVRAAFIAGTPAVAEPASLAVFALGIAGFAFLRRRRPVATA